MKRENWMIWRMSGAVILFFAAGTFWGDDPVSKTPMATPAPPIVSEPTAVRVPGEDGVAVYRIPGLVRSKAGTLIAVFDLRHHGFPDLPADIDVGASRSFDGGRTWEPTRIVLDFHGEEEAAEGVGDPAILVDNQTGRIWVAALWAHNRRGIDQSEPGLIKGKSARFVLTFSDDDGATWSEPRDITPELGCPSDYMITFQGPGNGITLSDGTLVFPAQYRTETLSRTSTLLVSRDHGQTWTLGEGAWPMTSEAAVVELVDGGLMLNMRNEKGEKVRAVAVTRDLGQTWTEHPTSLSVFPEPVCQASLIRVASKKSGEAADVLAFCNPKNRNERRDMTLQLSDDDGLTWTRSILIDPADGWGYSSMTMVDADTIGILYETKNGLNFRTVRWREIPRD